MTLTRRLLLVTLAVLVVAGSIAYGLEGPARYDAAAASYFYPRRPHRDLVLAAGLVGAALLACVAVVRRPVRHR